MPSEQARKAAAIPVGLTLRRPASVEEEEEEEEVIVAVVEAMEAGTAVKVTVPAIEALHRCKPTLASSRADKGQRREVAPSHTAHNRPHT